LKKFKKYGGRCGQLAFGFVCHDEDKPIYEILVMSRAPQNLGQYGFVRRCSGVRYRRVILEEEVADLMLVSLESFLFFQLVDYGRR